jgi:hypothetical protein
MGIKAMGNRHWAIEIPMLLALGTNSEGQGLLQWQEILRRQSHPIKGKDFCVVILSTQ